MLRIGQLAARTGFSDRTIRYYESIGLLAPRARSEGGYRLYGDEAVERLRLIERAKRLGLSLEEIREVTGLIDRGACPCGHVLELIGAQLSRAEAAISELEAFRDDLQRFRRRAERMPKTQGACEIIGTVEVRPLRLALGGAGRSPLGR
ncbi:MAG: MerR family transcriptional regulator [Solirubrobacteraceae bacterium]